MKKFKIKELKKPKYGHDYFYRFIVLKKIFLFIYKELNRTVSLEEAYSCIKDVCKKGERIKLIIEFNGDKNDYND